MGEGCSGVAKPLHISLFVRPSNDFFERLSFCDFVVEADEALEKG